ncbi:MAG: hypothetical protein AAF497_23905, partial [Planctomycetota bacterium]
MTGWTIKNDQFAFSSPRHDGGSLTFFGRNEPM